jgi:Uma2 family endonuclease
MNATPENHPMALQPRSETEGVCMTEEEYLASEPYSEVRREYIDGRAYAMAGESVNHNTLSANILRKFGNHLEGTPCATFMGGIKVSLVKKYVYPDVIVDCSKIEMKNYFANAPMIIVEVLSNSTRKRDLTTKLIQYINLPSLQEYVLIEQDFVQVQVLRKRTDWKYEFYFLGDSITFESIDLTLTVEEIYDRVNNDEINEFRQQTLLSQEQ